jgi:PDGLE domain
VRRTVAIGALVAAGLVIALVLAFLVGPRASSKPDGLEKVAADQGIDTGTQDSAAGDGPLADYSVKGVDDGSISTGLAGVIGVTVTFAFGLALFAVMRKVRHRNDETALAPGPGVPSPSGP